MRLALQAQRIVAADERSEPVVGEHDVLAMHGERFVQTAEQADQRALALVDHQFLHRQSARAGGWHCRRDGRRCCRCARARRNARRARWRRADRSARVSAAARRSRQTSTPSSTRTAKARAIAKVPKRAPTLNRRSCPSSPCVCATCCSDCRPAARQPDPQRRTHAQHLDSRSGSITNAPAE